MINFNSKYTILVIVLVAIALLFATWGIYNNYKWFFSSQEKSSYQLHNNRQNNEPFDLSSSGGRKRRRTKKVNKK